MATNVKVSKQGKVVVTTDDGQVINFEIAGSGTTTTADNERLILESQELSVNESAALATTNLMFSASQAASNAILASSKSLADTFIEMQSVSARAADMMLNGCGNGTSTNTVYDKTIDRNSVYG